MGCDRGENPSLMEPLIVSESDPRRSELMDLVVELAAKSAKFKSSLPAAIQSSLATMVRAMNCYYSNLIEGHNTHPIAIEKALYGNYDADPVKRNLQLEAQAHIKVQEWIDGGGLGNDIFSAHAICDIHRRFCAHLPEELLWIEDLDGNQRLKLIPGAFRDRDVKVGGHIPISAGAIPQFLSRYELAYSKLGKSETILALGASHHRLLWIHPFLDGNGRVARLMSHAAMLKALDSGSVWSISRGLARHVGEYKQHLANCDLLRRNDLDGRGNLSLEALVDFSKFFMTICIDQIAFMDSVMQPEQLRTRILIWTKEEIEMGHLPQQSMQILEAILYRGEISRSELSGMLNVTDRHARRLTSSLVEKGILISDTPKSPFKIAFPATLAHRWMPGLFPAL